VRVHGQEPLAIRYRVEPGLGLELIRVAPAAMKREDQGEIPHFAGRRRHVDDVHASPVAVEELEGVIARCEAGRTARSASATSAPDGAVATPVRPRPRARSDHQQQRDRQYRVAGPARPA
jgi:hypothetical protein